MAVEPSHRNKLLQFFLTTWILQRAEQSVQMKRLQKEYSFCREKVKDIYTDSYTTSLIQKIQKLYKTQGIEMNCTYQESNLTTHITNIADNDNTQEQDYSCFKCGNKGYTVGLKFFSTKNEAMMTKTRKRVLL